MTIRRRVYGECIPLAEPEEYIVFLAHIGWLTPCRLTGFL